MSLHEQIKTDMKEAMKAKESGKVMVLRGVMSAFTNEAVAKRVDPQTILTDEDALEVITREAKKRKDAIQQFIDGGREDLAQDEKSELEVLEAYLPEMMSKEEIKKIAEAKKAELGIDDKSKMGQLMGMIMGELKGKADGNDVKDVVSALFE
jgi:uncharacterized protein YqeY